jgi:NADH-quinone oxidoreductase subunit L
VFVRPAALIGRFAQSTFERYVVNGAIVGGATTVVRAGSQAVRAAQTGLLRSYAATLLIGVAAVVLYFLIRS